MATIKKKRFFKRKNTKREALSINRKEKNATSNEGRAYPIVEKAPIKNKRLPTKKQTPPKTVPDHNTTMIRPKESEGNKKTSRLTPDAIRSTFFPKNSGSITEQAQKKKFPKLFRFITEKLFWSMFFSTIIVVMIVLGAVDLQNSLKQKTRGDENRRKIQSQIIKWQQIVKKYPDYRDGYFHLALMEYQLGDKAETKKYNEKVLQLDPNFKVAERLKMILRD